MIVFSTKLHEQPPLRSHERFFKLEFGVDDKQLDSVEDRAIVKEVKEDEKL